MVELNEQFDGLVMQINQLRFWHECLWDAVELVDWRNGEIRNSSHQPVACRKTLKGYPATAPSTYSEVG